MKQLFKPIPLLLLSLATWITLVFISLFHSVDGEGLLVGSFSIWGDWSAHLSFTEAFRQRGLSWILDPNPLFQDAPFRYPFLSHLFTAFLSMGLGIQTIHGMVFTSALFLFLLPFLLFRFFQKWNLSPRASLYSTLGFLLMGGLQIFDSSLNPAKPLTNQFEHGSIFTSFLLFELYPQRAFLFGLCAVLWSTGTLLGKSNKHSKRLALFVLGILPLVHLHSFIAIPFFLLALLCFPRKDSGDFTNRAQVVGRGAVIGGIGALCLWFLFRSPNPFPHQWRIFLPGWAQNEAAGQSLAASMNPLWFWIYNTGVFLPLAFIEIVLSRRNRNLMSLALAGFLLFLVALLFCVQPYFYDNLKLFTYSFLFFAPFFGLFLDRFQGALRSAALLLLALQCASATRDLWSFQQGIEKTVWFTELDQDLASEFKKLRSSPDARVLITPIHNHPIPCLTGNPVVMGYPGWLWSWGINYTLLERKAGSVLLGSGDALEQARSLGAEYIVVGSQETFQNHPISFSFLDSNFRKLKTLGPWRIYKVEPPLR
jgi:hypothetical protein